MFMDTRIREIRICSLLLLAAGDDDVFSGAVRDALRSEIAGCPECADFAQAAAAAIEAEGREAERADAAMLQQILRIDAGALGDGGLEALVRFIAEGDALVSQVTAAHLCSVGVPAEGAAVGRFLEAAGGAECGENADVLGAGVFLVLESLRERLNQAGEEALGGLGVLVWSGLFRLVHECDPSLGWLFDLFTRQEVGRVLRERRGPWQPEHLSAVLRTLPCESGMVVEALEGVKDRPLPPSVERSVRCLVPCWGLIFDEFQVERVVGTLKGMEDVAEELMSVREMGKRESPVRNDESCSNEGLS